MKQRREAIVGVAGEMEHAAFAFERDPHAALRVSVIGAVESQWDFGSSVMEARILRPLQGGLWDELRPACEPEEQIRPDKPVPS
jgi:hypothetical protein